LFTESLPEKICDICSSNIPVGSNGWHCLENCNFDVCRSCAKSFATPLPLRCHQCENTNKGDLIGISLDMDSRNLFFHRNGVETADKFVGSATDTKAWSAGLYPFFYLSPEEEIEVNFGSKPFSYAPSEGYGAVLVQKDAHLKLQYYCFNMKLQSSEWLPLQLSPHGIFSTDVDNTALSLSLLQSCRLYLSMGLESKSNDAKISIDNVKFISKSSLLPFKWTHIKISVDIRTANIYIDGVLDSSLSFGTKKISWNNYPALVGGSDTSLWYDGTGSLWIASFYFSWLPDKYSISGTDRIPFNQKITEQVISLFRNNATNLFPQVLNSISEQELIPENSDQDLSIDSFSIVELLLAILKADDKSRDPQLITLTKQSVIDSISKICLGGIAPSNRVENRKLYSRFITLLSYTDAGRNSLIKQDAFLRIINDSNLDNHFYLEVALSNLYSLSEKPTDIRSENLCFTKRVDPFGNTITNSTMWRLMPIGFFPILQEPSLLVEMLALALDILIKRGNHTENDMAWKYEKILQTVLTICIMLIVTPEKTEYVLEPSSHPYSENENISGELGFLGSLKLECVFDPSTATEKKYDYLKLWTSEARDVTSTVRTSSTDEEGKFSGTAPEDWKPFEVVTNKLYYSWFSDGSNCDWGVKMYIKALYPDIPDRQFHTDRLISAGIIKQLVEYQQYTDRETSNTLSQLLTELFESERARDEVTSSGILEFFCKQLHYLPFKVLKDSKIINPDRSATEGVEVEIVKGETFLVDSREWMSSDGVEDPGHKSKEGYYRLHIAQPPKYRGYINQETDENEEKNVVNCEHDDDFLTIIGNLCLNTKNRKIICDGNCLSNLLQISKTGVTTCIRAVCMSLNDLASTNVDWLKSSAAYALYSKTDSE
jgi:hypothetical protein